MKNHIPWLAQLFVGGGGAVVFALAGSFGWQSATAKPESVLGVHSVILIAAGVALLAASLFIRHASSRIAALEKQVAHLRRTNG